MKHGWIGLIVALAVTPAALAKVSAARPADAPAPNSALVEGQIIPSGYDTVIGGWKKLWTADYASRITAGTTTTETLVCCEAVFGNGNAYLVLKTEAVTRNARGEPLTERIQRKMWVTKRPGEIEADCQLLWIAPALNLVDQRSDAIRSVVVDGGQLVMINWRDSGSHCAFGD